MGLVVDLFAGGGGASLGLKWALGRDPDIAINHDPDAVAMHRANHPGTRHFCQDVWRVPPARATQNRPVDLLWASPDCTHFSKAKGGRPRKQNIRDLAWVVVEWAKTVRPAVIILENVEEFRTWGPLDDAGRPVRELAGSTFEAWVGKLRREGYKVEWRCLRACDYGAPTIRKRLFLVARCDGQAIIWPEPTHGPGRDLPWRTASECIDWSLPCPSIFERARPLAENTMKRIAAGIKRFVLEAAEPFIVTYYGTKGEDFRGQGPAEPLKTQTAENRHALVMPFVVPATHHGDVRSHGPEEPLRTVTAAHRGERALVSAFLAGAGGPSYGGKPASLGRPCGTLLAENHQALVTAFLAKHYSGVVGSAPQAPLGTVTSIDHHSVVSAHLEHMRGRSGGAPLSGPSSTVTARAHEAVVTSHLLKLYGTCQDGQDLRAPAPTVTAGGLHAAEVRALLIKYYGQGIGQSLSDPAATVTAKHRLGLVTVLVGGEPFVIADIGLRMLQPRELFRAQGFP
ncbi:MAG: DNA cytosine methyltransferase, partial [Deltaproteobacteria bacterium]|nr:DNA cytosine methyltransferase [Deltaproteobacteria bacterium]